ncbi:MAG: hypothetical protein EOO73_29785 [Myxococcales bacterium]|nr:MAG: hypothetical protein EOO73_29785 [Myxococcales bacterium]
MILALALGRLGAGLCLAAPLASLLAESGVGQRAEGDRALFEGGGYLLLEVLRLQGPALAAALRGLLPVLGLGLLLTALGNAALLVALSTHGRLRSLGWLGPALARLPALCALGVGTALGQGLLLLIGAIVAGGAPEGLTNPRQGTALQLAAWLAALLAAGALGGWADIAKAALVRHESPLLAALARAWQALRNRPIFGLFGWVPYALPFVLAAFGVAWLTGVVDVGRSGAWRLVVVFGLHQLVVVVAVACRAAWFARALRAVCAVP